MKNGGHRNRPAKGGRGPPSGSHPIPKHGAPSPYQAPNQPAQNNKPSYPDPDRWMVRWTMVVALFTVVLSGVGALQFWAFVQSERAFLSVSGFEIVGGLPHVGDTTVRLSVEFRNGGRSTAFPKLAQMNMRLGPLPPKREYAKEPQFVVPPILPDSILRDHDTIVLPHAVSQTDVDSIKAGTIRISVLGYITYSDIFGLFGDRTSGFCFTYAPSPPEAPEFDACREPEYTYAE